MNWCNKRDMGLHFGALTSGIRIFCLLRAQQSHSFVRNFASERGSRDLLDLNSFPFSYPFVVCWNGLEVTLFEFRVPLGRCSTIDMQSVVFRGRVPALRFAIYKRPRQPKSSLRFSSISLHTSSPHIRIQSRRATRTSPVAKCLCRSPGTSIICIYHGHRSRDWMGTSPFGQCSFAHGMRPAEAFILCRRKGRAHTMRVEEYRA